MYIRIALENSYEPLCYTTRTYPTTGLVLMLVNAGEFSPIHRTGSAYSPRTITVTITPFLGKDEILKWFPL